VYPYFKASWANRFALCSFPTFWERRPIFSSAALLTIQKQNVAALLTDLLFTLLFLRLSYFIKEVGL
jgi:hypothetical protein